MGLPASRGTGASPPASPRERRRARLLIEFLLLFVGMPTAYALGLLPLPLLPALWLFALGCLASLWADRSFERRRLWGTRRLLPRLGRALVPFGILAPLLALIVARTEPERFFAFVRQRPLLWLIVMLLYPVLSAYPQGIVYRAFLFHRYRELFPGPRTMLLASAGAFAMVHVVFGNWIAPTFSLIGGLIFARTYQRTGSSLVATIQHALFGCFVFTVGWGWYFYHGAVHLRG